MYYLCIKSRSGTKLYWNRFSAVWVDYVANATPYTAVEIVRMAPFGFGIKSERSTA